MKNYLKKSDKEKKGNNYWSIDIYLLMHSLQNKKNMIISFYSHPDHLF